METEKEFQFVMSHLSRKWIEICGEYQDAKGQFPSHWTREECYWFSRALIAVEVSNALEVERMRG